ncbi:beta-N-acetylhexosaminidase [Nonomuraea sp. NPDC050783]|uniref:beta-N-acetylhexosaminidase n=1 Tax=Nonomuraea sp. NPDC050783 TaxID=3154634 RepID=UPI0034654B1F
MKLLGAAALVLTLLAASVAASGPASATATTLATPTEAAPAVSFGSVVPAPVSAVPAKGVEYHITPATTVHSDVRAVGDLLAQQLRRSTGYRIPLVSRPRPHGITLRLGHVPGGEEAYRLDVAASGVRISANGPAGLFYGVQTLRQLLPYAAESPTVRSGPWPVPGGRIVDRPRYGYRGAMLDVARHFFPVPAVKRYIDQIALYKINHLHLHLTDDQGWRIAIDSWPRLATFGGGTAVGGDPGGYYTKAEYREIIAYAAARHITVVPEIDMPGHTNAALASYAELNCDGVAPPPYTGTRVGFSSLCVSKEITYAFIDQVLGELAALTPGPYLHIGGDEAASTQPADYRMFMERAQAVVARHGKTVVGWHDIVKAATLPDTVAQYWGTTRTADQVAAAGRKVIMSPASRAYLDMKYNPDTPLGLTWAGLIEVQDAYGWDPGSFLTGLPADRVLGVEAPLWSETIRTSADIEFMAFPRLPALAELGWSPQSTHDWTSFGERLGAQGPRWRVMGVNYYRSTQVAWPPGS